jgi:curli production assembly/transport component CsgG/holdfast attachment protein HfaB
VTQGAPLMAMSALGRAGVPLVERYETDTPRLEFRLADNRLISDAPAQEAGEGGERPYRPIMPGSVTGADYFLTGGITELNANLRSGQLNATGGEQPSGSSSPARVYGNIGGGYYVLNVAIDLRLVDMRTLDVVDMVSYQKQIVGRELSGGAYAFFGNNVLNISGTTGGEEPIQFSIRSLIERGVLEMVGRRYGVDGPALCLGGPDSDPLGGMDSARHRQVVGPPDPGLRRQRDVRYAPPQPAPAQPEPAAYAAPPAREPEPAPAQTMEATYAPPPEPPAEPAAQGQAYPYRMLTWPSRQARETGR